jgi:hypothetical protein
MRYTLSRTYVFTQELEWYLFRIVYLLAAGYTLLHDEHVPGLVRLHPLPRLFLSLVPPDRLHELALRAELLVRLGELTRPGRHPGAVGAQAGRPRWSRSRSCRKSTFRPGRSPVLQTSELSAGF